MNKQESYNKQLEAYKLYISGMAKDTIAKQLNTSHHTIDNWEEKGNWVQDKIKLSRESAEKVYDSVEEERERTLRLIHGAESVIAKKIQDNTLKADLSSLAAIERVKWELIEPKKGSIEQDSFNVTITCSGDSNGNKNKDSEL